MSPLAKATGDKPAAAKPTARPVGLPAGRQGKLIPALLGLAVGLVAGYGAGRVSVGSSINPLAGKGSYEEGYAAAVQKLNQSGIFPAAPTETRTLSGTVTAVESGAVTFDADLRTANPLVDLPGPKQRVARITKETKIVIPVALKPEEFNARQSEFQKASAAGKVATPPSTFDLKPYEATLKAGDVIVVESANNILTAGDFDALMIIVNSQSAPNAVGQPAPPSAGGNPAPPLPPPTQDPNQPASTGGTPREEAPRI